MGTGSMRLRGRDSWQLRVYLGADPETRRPRWLNKTVHGTQRFAGRQLDELSAEAGRARIRAGTLADLLDRWIAAASPGWSAPTVSHTRSIVECHLKPDLGHLHLAKLTTADIDDFYAHLLRAGGRDDRPLAPGTVARVHAVLHRALAQAMRWDWIWLNPASSASPPRVPTPEIRPPSPGQVAVLLDWSRREDPALFCYLSSRSRLEPVGASFWRCGGVTSTWRGPRSRSRGPWSKAPTVLSSAPRRPTAPTGSSSMPRCSMC